VHDDHPSADAHKEEEKKKKKDPDSKHFVAPGNIYRVLAVEHPGRIGFKEYGNYCVKAGIVAYMQLYIPLSIIGGVFAEWQYAGFKSPMWFATNFWSFLTMLGGLGTLCHSFKSYCEHLVLNDAKANVHLITHDEPEGASQDEDAQPEDQDEDRDAETGGGNDMSKPLLDTKNPGKAVDEAEGAAMAAAKSELEHLLKPELSEFWIDVNEMFWCYVSACMTLMMSILLEACLILKVCTFTGAPEKVALIAVALYFVVDLDKKVFDADPRLKTRYMRAVLRQTIEKPEKRPRMLCVCASFALILVRFASTIGFICIILLAWRNQDGHVLGGDPFTLHGLELAE